MDFFTICSQKRHEPSTSCRRIKINLDLITLTPYLTPAFDEPSIKSFAFILDKIVPFGRETIDSTGNLRDKSVI